MSTDKSGPAFPQPINPGEHGRGLTMRDYFAAKAMQGLIVAGKYVVGMAQEPETTQYAENAYRQADAMLKEREK